MQSPSLCGRDGVEVGPVRRCARGMAWVLISSLALSAAFPRSAFAEETAADRATARQLAAEGQAAFEKGDFETAADRFARADTLVHAPTLLLALARAQVKLGKLVQANENYQRILREGVPAGTPPRSAAVFQQAVDDAKQEAGAIAPRLAWVTLSVTGSPDPIVVLDGDTPVPRAALDVKRAVNPGEHVVRVTAEGCLPTDGKFSVTEGEATEVKLNLEVDPNAHKAPTTAPTGIEPKTWSAAAGPGTDRGTSSGSSQRTLGFVALGVGGVGLVTGGITGVLAMGKHSTLARECTGGSCPPSQSSTLDSYRTLGTVSTIGFIVAGVGAATGLALILTAPKTPPAASSARQVTVTVGYQSIGLSTRF